MDQKQSRLQQQTTENIIAAARNGRFEDVELLVPLINDQSNRDTCCINAAEKAANNDHFEIVEFLLSKINDQSNRDTCCIKAAETAAVCGHFEDVKHFLSQINDESNRDTCCINAAEWAAFPGHFEDVKHFLSQINDQSKRDTCRIKAAKNAANYGHLKIVEFLLSQINDESNRDTCCIKAAESAADNGHFEIVEFLLSQINGQSNRDTCCIKAAESAADNGHFKIVKSLISRLSSDDLKAKLRFQCAVKSCSRLHENVVAFLGLEPQWLFQSNTILSFTAAMAIERRNSVLTDTLSQMQPAQITHLLRLSISQRHVALAATLLNHQRFSTQHVNLPDDNTGATALMLAADAGHHELIHKLIDLGASLHTQDTHGRTALSRACQAGHVRAAKTLIDNGADASHRDSQGLTCAQLAQRFEQRQVLRLLNPTQNPQHPQPAAQRLHQLSDHYEQDRRLSEELHRLLSDAGFTEQRAKCQHRLADLLEEVARDLTQDYRQMTGSYAEGWANSLVQVNGRTAADSDIDWTVLVAGQNQKFHLEGGCEGIRDFCRDATRLQVKEGHAQVSVGAGSQPAVTATACGVRPAQDTCHAIWCCSSFCEDRIRELLDTSDNDNAVHLVRATRPSSTNELRVSFSFQEKRIMRDLSTVQGQLFTLIKFIFKRHLPLNLDTPGLKTYHAKTLLFFMLEKHGKDPETEAWQPHNLIALLKESLDMMLNFIDSSSSPDECMPHFFMPDAPLYFKNAGIGGDFDNTKARVRDRLCELRSDIGGVVEQLRRLVKPLQSEKFYFHPFTLLPLTAPPAVTEISEGSYKTIFADVYIAVHHCVSELQSESSDRDTLMRQLSLLHELQRCECAALCMTAMAHLKFGESEEAERLAMELQRHQVESGLRPQEIQRDEDYDQTELPDDSDLAWRFCLPCDSPPRFPFLPEFTQTLFTARLSQPLSSHLYVNFRCLSWSLQAELLRNRATAIAFDHWIEQLLGDSDSEELLGDPDSEELLGDSDSEELLGDPDLEELLGDSDSEELLGDPDSEELLGDSDSEELLGDSDLEELLGDPDLEELLGDSDSEELLGDPDSEELLGDSDSEELLGDSDLEELLGDSDSEEMLGDPDSKEMLGDSDSEEMLGDPDLEELLTLAHYSDCLEHVELSLQQMEMIEKKRRVVMETQDEEKIGWVREKRWRVSNRSGSDSGAHRSREDEERRLWARARLRRDGADLGRLVAMETAAEQRDSWTHAKLSRMRLMKFDRLDAAAGVLKVESQRRDRKRKAESD
ncbi:hypothetical protein BOX15_Mlig025919g1 [Macrostomum lignano]|uniref:Mab-21-like HhH/H2TH-like domain-containing protein n=1 Tax=Macrostomum lignano TaxID=282301 RepID=A0A267F3I7_9PLAT|nr:hypothetical protein BOX15_Mlig025919g1 [Macrostomum lignano]